MKAVRFLLRYTFQSGAAVSFLTPLLINIVLTYRVGANGAASWLLALAWASWMRQTFSSKFTDIGNHFYGISEAAGGRHHSPAAFSLVMENGFFLIQTIGLSVAAFMVDQLRPAEIALMLVVVTSQSFRDQALFLIRLKFGAEIFFKISWVDGFARISLVAVPFLVPEPSVIALITPYLVPVPFYTLFLLYEIVANFRSYRAGFSHVPRGFGAYFVIQQINTFARVGYRNIDIVIVPQFLSGETLWAYLTLRLVALQAPSISIGPKTHATVPKLVSKFKGYSTDFLPWFSKKRIEFALFSGLTGALGIFLITPAIFGFQLLMPDKWEILAYLTFIGQIRANLWWNKDLLFLFHKFSSTAIQVGASAISLIAIFIAYWLDSVTIFFVGNASSFVVAFIISEYLFRKRLVCRFPSERAFAPISSTKA